MSGPATCADNAIVCISSFHMFLVWMGYVQNDLLHRAGPMDTRPAAPWCTAGVCFSSFRSSCSCGAWRGCRRWLAARGTDCSHFKVCGSSRRPEAICQTRVIAGHTVDLMQSTGITLLSSL